MAIDFNVKCNLVVTEEYTHTQYHVMDVLVLGHSVQFALVKLLIVKSLSWFMNLLSIWIEKLKYGSVSSPSNLVSVRFCSMVNFTCLHLR